MASSMLSGERRFLSARRGGMTVLGKVAVPKPVNLPSQRLENHGLDPKVEIVPKGTLSWGSRSSSSAPNAWGSPALSPPSTDGVTGSPSWLSGRPSSGGSGTRPSTAGSDRSHEPAASNTWGPNSRPSSASGVSALNNTSMATMRPSSAETRPGSSQLSRFAESIPEKSAAWGALGTAEQLRAASFNGFTLSSGDFPTLGSEKNTESHERQGHSSQGRPVSASGRLATLKDSPGTSLTEDEHIDANSEGRMVNAWKRESSSYVGDGPPPSMEKWQRDRHSFPNNNMPIQHLDPWHGIPVCHTSDGVWYRGPPGGPLYGTPGPPGSYPHEPFTYYHPQVPARPLANSQPVPGPGAVPPRGYHPKNGDSYRPQMPESYIRPIMPVRPGVYQGMVPYEGYYGPPCVGFCNSSERDAPVLGMAAGPFVYNGYPNHNLRPDSGNLHSMSGGYDSASTAMTKEQVEAGQSRGTQRGPYKVLLKQHDGWDEKEGEEKRDHDVTINAPHLERGHEPRTSMRENDRGTDHSTKDAADLPKTALSGISSSQSTDICEGSSIPVSVKIPEGMSSHKAVVDIVVKKPETPAISGGVPQLLSATKRNPTLIDKIQGLNTKARISDGRYDVGAVSSSNEKMKRFRVVNANVNHSINEAGGVAICAEKTYNEGMLNPSSHEVGTYTGSKSLDLAAPSGTAVSMSVCGSQASTGNMLSSEIEEKTRAQIHKSMLGVEGRVGDRGKGRFNIQEGEEWRKKPLVAKTSTVVPIANTETSDVNVQDFHASQEASERSNSNLQGKAGGEHATSTFDITNYDAQRAMMREIAAQRAKQLQKEEEERIREQKAKANAKLEELNRRMLAESSTQKLDHAVPPSGSVQLKQDSRQKLDHAVPPSGSVQLKQEDSRSSAAPKPDTSNSIETTCSALGRNSNTVAQMSEDSINRLGGSTILFGDIPIETLKCYPQDSVVSQNLSLPLRQNVDILEVTNGKTALQVEESIVSKQKQTDHKKKRNVPSSKNLSEMVISTGNTAGSRSHTNLVTNVSASSGESILTGNPSTMDDPSPQQKKKTNRSGKGKHKLEEAFSGTLPLLVPNSSKPSAENVKPNASEAKLEVLTVHAQISRETGEVQDSQDVVPSADQGWSLPSEEAHDRVNNQWKPQPRRVPRNPLASRSAEKFHSSEAVVWAPVQLQNKNEASEEASRNTTLETNISLTKKGHGVQSSWTKIKRAEMERYVPKPVAKEMSQQGNTVRPLSHSITHATSDEATRRAESGSPSTESSGPNGLATRITGSAVEPRNGESKNNKHGKAHGSGRQYGSTESPSPVQGFHEGSTFPSDPSKTALKSIVQHQPLKPEIHSLKGPAKFSDNRDTDNLVSTELVTGPVVKDHGTTGKGKRHPYKGHRGTGQSHKPVDHKDLHGGSDKNETQSLAFELSQPDGRNILRESHGVGEHSTSHWQPKSQPYVAHDRGQKVVAHPSRTSEKEFAPQGGGHLSSQNVDTSASLDQLQSQTPKTNLDEVPIVRHQVAKNEKKDVDSFNEREFSPNQGPLNPTEVAPANIDAQHGQVFSSRSQRHGQHHGRYGRLQELPHGGRTPAGQDSSKHYRLPANGDRRHNSHYEYQPVGSHNDKSSDSFERAAEGSRLMGSRYRERGQNHSRRGGGNFYGRNNGPV